MGCDKKNVIIVIRLNGQIPSPEDLPERRVARSQLALGVVTGGVYRPVAKDPQGVGTASGCGHGGEHRNQAGIKPILLVAEPKLYI